MCKLYGKFGNVNIYRYVNIKIRYKKDWILKKFNVEGNNMDKLIFGGYEFNSRLLVGIGKYGLNNILFEVIKESGSEIIIMVFRRVDLDNK